MTEEEWLKATDPRPMLEWLLRNGRLTDRKARLFGVACCRRIWPLLTDERSQRAVEVAEGFADGLSGEEELASAQDGANEHAYECWFGRAKDAASAADWVAWRIATESVETIADDAARAAAWKGVVGEETVGWEHSRGDIEYEVHSTLLRCIVGNPFRFVIVVPSWLAWNDATVPKIAQSIYDDRRFDELPILADALEEAGCSDPDILGHCRGPDPHVRGCWVVDLLLGRS